MLDFADAGAVMIIIVVVELLIVIGVCGAGAGVMGAVVVDGNTYRIAPGLEHSSQQTELDLDFNYMHTGLTRCVRSGPNVSLHNMHTHLDVSCTPS